MEDENLLREVVGDDKTIRNVLQILTKKIVDDEEVLLS